MADVTPSQEKQLRDAFNLFDKDRSGQLSKSELKHVFRALSIKADDKGLQALFKQMDVNGSGDIDFNEFKAAMAKFYFRRRNTKELEAAFKKYDSDGNGFLTMDELQTVMSNMGRHMTQSEVRSMVQSLDLNNDGKISFDEFTRMFD